MIQDVKNTLRRWILWSQQYTKTDMIYLARGGFWLALGQSIGSLSSLILAIVFANLIPKEVYGNYKFILATTAILSAVSLTGMGSLVVQAIARGTEGMLKDAVYTSLRWGILTLIAGIAASFYYFINNNPILGISMFIAGIALPLINSFGLYGTYFSGKKNFKLSTLYGVGSQLIVASVLIATILITENIVAMVAAYFLTSALVNLLAFKFVTSQYPMNTLRDNSLITYGKHVSLMNLFGAIANHLDKILVFHYLGATNLALYSFSQAIPDQFRGAFKNLMSLALPKLATLPEIQLRQSVKQKFLQLTGLTIFLVILYIIVAPLIFQLLFPKYVEAVFYSQIYMLGMITIPGIALFANYFQLRKATRIAYKISVWSHASTLIITFVLIYTWGLMGAAIANGVSWLVMVLIHWYYFAQDEKLQGTI